MTAADAPRFEYALTRLARLELRQAPDRDMMRDWWQQLERYPIDAVVAAMHQAPGERERRGERLMTAGLVEGLCRKHAAAQNHGPHARFVPKGQAVINAPGTRLHGKTVTVVEGEFDCAECRNTGYVQSWQMKRDGIEAETLARYTSVRRCECKLRSA